MRPQLRESVRLRYDSCCGYCGVSETDTGARLTVDHHQPQIQGGTDDDDNLVYACHACNQFKSDYWPSDPEERLLHPSRDDVSLHYAERSDCVLTPLTERGRWHIEILHLNRPELIAARRRRAHIAQEVARFTALQREFDQLTAEKERLAQTIARITGGIPFDEND